MQIRLHFHIGSWCSTWHDMSTWHWYNVSSKDILTWIMFCAPNSGQQFSYSDADSIGRTKRYLNVFLLICAYKCICFLFLFVHAVKINSSIYNLTQSAPVLWFTVRCTELPDSGPCRDSFTKWYYDPFQKMCFRFNYGGCSGNDNRFDSPEACIKVCRGVTGEF